MDSCGSIASNDNPFGTMNPGKIDDRAKQLGNVLGDRQIVIPPAECPTRMTLPSLSDAASFTSATTACVRSGQLRHAGNRRRLGGECGGVERANTKRLWRDRLCPRAGRSSVSTALPRASSMGVTFSHVDWLCQPPWTRTKAALRGIGSDLPSAESENLNAGVVRGVKLAVRCRRSTLRTGKRVVHRLKIIEIHRPDQVNIGRPGQH